MKTFSRDSRSGGDRGPSSFGARKFGGGGFGGGRPSFGGGSRGGFGGGADRGDREMFSATCSKCGKECKIPFRPSGARPVFCSNCFEAEKNAGGGERPSYSRPAAGGFNRPAPSYSAPRPVAPSVSPDQMKQQFDALNAKLDRILRAIAPAEEAKKAVSTVAIAQDNAPKEALGKVKKSVKFVKKAVTKKKK